MGEGFIVKLIIVCKNNEIWKTDVSRYERHNSINHLKYYPA